MNAHSCVLGKNCMSLAALFGYGVFGSIPGLEMEWYASQFDAKSGIWICIELGLLRTCLYRGFYQLYIESKSRLQLSVTKV